VTALLPIRVEGLENLPRSGSYILVANHISWLDPPMIEFALGVPIRYMAKRELFAVPVIGFVLRAIGNFPVRRGESDRRALETALRVLEAGQPLGYFPEGTRSKDGVLHRAKPGIAFLARRSGAPLVPVAISGTPEARLRLPPRTEIVVRVGRPVSLVELGGGPDDQALADAIFSRVAALLPSHMRGVYAETDR
jgi:1-acyl-sn-glycerol-3-phosphate acyltransferase